MKSFKLSDYVFRRKNMASHFVYVWGGERRPLGPIKSEGRGYFTFSGKASSHTDPTIEFQCPYCNKTMMFYSDESIRNHIRDCKSYDGEKITICNCKRCLNFYSSGELVRQHLPFCTAHINVIKHDGEFVRNRSPKRHHGKKRNQQKGA